MEGFPPSLPDDGVGSRDNGSPILGIRLRRALWRFIFLYPWRGDYIRRGKDFPLAGETYGSEGRFCGAGGGARGRFRAGVQKGRARWADKVRDDGRETRMSRFGWLLDPYVELTPRWVGIVEIVLVALSVLAIIGLVIWLLWNFQPMEIWSVH